MRAITEERCEHLRMTAVHESDRLRALVETGIAINSELSLDAVLERIAEAAARVTGARYAALGVIDPTGSGLERFVTFGIAP
jgi:two-component system sensor histidine kinase DevS